MQQQNDAFGMNQERQEPTPPKSKRKVSVSGIIPARSR